MHVIVSHSFINIVRRRGAAQGGEKNEISFCDGSGCRHGNWLWQRERGRRLRCRLSSRRPWGMSAQSRRGGGAWSGRRGARPCRCSACRSRLRGRLGMAQWTLPPNLGAAIGCNVFERSGHRFARRNRVKAKIRTWVLIQSEPIALTAKPRLRRGFLFDGFRKEKEDGNFPPSRTPSQVAEATAAERSGMPAGRAVVHRTATTIRSAVPARSATTRDTDGIG